MNKLLTAMILIAAVSHAADTSAPNAKEHNFIVSAGANFNTGFVNLDTSWTKDTLGLASQLIDPTGGGYNIEAGYLWKTGSRYISVIDARLGFGQNFDAFTCLTNSDSTSTNSGYLKSIFLYAGATYSGGLKAGDGLFFVDILGFNIGWITTALQYGDKNLSLGNSFLFSVNLPAGLHYIFDWGLAMGIRHRIDFAFGESPTTGSSGVTSGSYFGTGSEQNDYIAYNIMFSVGYAFGL